MSGTPAGCWEWDVRAIDVEGKRSDMSLRARLKELAAKRMRFGYRRPTAMLVREGAAVNHKRVYRLYRQECLAMRIGQRRRIGWVGPASKPAARRPNEKWCRWISSVMA